jgi:filamentous hemagglutinin
MGLCDALGNALVVTLTNHRRHPEHRRGPEHPQRRLDQGRQRHPGRRQRLGLGAAGTISATGDLTAQAGRDLTLNKVGISAGGNLGLAAGRDVTATAATLSAGNHAQLSAGNDLSLNAIGRTEAVGGASQGIETTTHTVTTVNAGGSAILAAGRDLSSQGAQLSAGDVLAVSAGRDVTLNAVTDKLTQKDARLEGKTQVSERSTDELLRGSSLDATNGLIVSAGRDLTTTAATLTSEQGGIALAAGRDINLNAGVETHTWEQDTKTKKSGTLSSTTTTTHDATEDKLAIGTLISGDSITLAAGRDLTTQAAQIGATNDVILAAGNNLTIGTATSTHSETHDKTVKKTGVMSNGIGVMLGQSKESQGYQQTDTTPTGSLIGSTDGRVTLSAGNDVHITGSDILSQTGTAIVGKNVTIDAAVGTTETTQTYKKTTAGLSAGVAGGAVSVAQGVYGSVKRASEVKDGRLSALYAAQSAYLVSDALGGQLGPMTASQKGTDPGTTGYRDPLNGAMGFSRDALAPEHRG